MCNAYNHPPNCDCGWGGDAKHFFESGGERVRSPEYGEGRVFNTFCPVCGESVFYYWNDSGSSVYFDTLGKPWPKHPCTSVASEQRIRGRSDRSKKKATNTNHSSLKRCSELLNIMNKAYDENKIRLSFLISLYRKLPKDKADILLKHIPAFKDGRKKRLVLDDTYQPSYSYNRAKYIALTKRIIEESYSPEHQ